MSRRLRDVVLASAIVTAFLWGAPAARGQDLPRVRVITTGGTIGMIGTAELTAEGLVAAIPPLAENARIELEEFVRTGSSGMTPDHWLRLSARVNEVLDADPELAGVVVTHGTDTMEETAYLLHLTVDDERAVVITGSMRSSDAISADGPANVLSAVRVAANPAARGRGVLVVLNDEIHSARDVRKTDSNRVETFVSAEWGALGVADSDRIVFRRAILTKHTTGSEMVAALRGVTALPLVPIVADFAGNDGSEVRGWADRGARGIVVQAFGGGRSSPKMTEAMREVASRGIPVVRASRVPEGRVLSAEAQTEAGIVTSEDLPPHKARVLLMLAILETRSIADIQRIFDTH